MRAIVAVAAVALCAAAVVAPASAGAATVTETAAAGPLPNAVGIAPPTTWGEFQQRFELSGKKVKRKRIVDVDLTINATAAPSAGADLSGVSVRLIAPSGETLFLRVPGIGAPAGSSWVDLAFDEQSTLRTCDPTSRIRPDCNYLLGDTTYTGKLHASFRSTFKNANPKGSWTLMFQDRQPGNEPASAIGVSTLVLKTGKRFEKD